MRSNHLAYYLQKLCVKKKVKKENNYYMLAQTTEREIPYLSEKVSPLPVLLVHVGKSNPQRAFLPLRTKRPFQGRYGLPGGRLLNGETIAEGTKRILKKYSLTGELERVHSVTLEHAKKDDCLLHSFLLIFVSAQTKESPPLTPVKKNKKDLIQSDYRLLTIDLKKEISLQEVETPED